MKNLEKIYIIHNPELVERKNYLDSMLKKFNLEDISEYVFFNDKKTITDETISKCLTHTPEDFKKRQDGMGSIVTNEFQAFELRKVAICITLDHIECYKRIVESDHKYSLILEDDVIFIEDNFAEKLDNYLTQLEKTNEPYVFYIGQGFDVRDFNAPGKFTRFSENILINNSKMSHYSDSYVISKEACKIFLKECVPFYFSIDWELNYLHRKFNVLSLNLHSVLTRQGSSKEYSTSNIKPKN